jgi:hypothetical protein
MWQGNAVNPMDGAYGIFVPIFRFMPLFLRLKTGSIDRKTGIKS